MVAYAQLPFQLALVAAQSSLSRDTLLLVVAHRVKQQCTSLPDELLFHSQFRDVVTFYDSSRSIHSLMQRRHGYNARARLLSRMRLSKPDEAIAFWPPTPESFFH